MSADDKGATAVAGPALSEGLGPAPRWWHCDTHGPGNHTTWGCPECVREMRAELGQLRHALAQSGKLAEDRLQQMKADRDEFLNLRGKIDRAPRAIVDTRDALGLCAPTEEDFPALQALQGRRVALVDLGPNVRPNLTKGAANEA